MLLFDSEGAIERWCTRHGMLRGDVQPLEKIRQFASVWYGRHRDPEWKKWSAAEAREIFSTFGLGGPTWEIPDVADRF